MSLFDLLRTALRSVSANKLRAALTMLGVVIGVASVIAMLALGNGARAAVDATFQSLGANQIQVGILGQGDGGHELRPKLPFGNLQALLVDLDGCAGLIDPEVAQERLGDANSSAAGIIDVLAEKSISAENIAVNVAEKVGLNTAGFVAVRIQPEIVAKTGGSVARNQCAGITPGVSRNFA